MERMEEEEEKEEDDFGMLFCRMFIFLLNDLGRGVLHRSRDLSGKSMNI